MKCPICGTEVTNTLKNCPTCGRIIEPEPVKDDMTFSLDDLLENDTTESMRRPVTGKLTMKDNTQPVNQYQSTEPKPQSYQMQNEQPRSQGYKIQGSAGPRTQGYQMQGSRQSGTQGYQFRDDNDMSQQPRGSQIPSRYMKEPNPAMRFSPSLQNSNNVRPAAVNRNVPKQKKSILPKIGIAALIMMIIGAVGSFGGNNKNNNSTKDSSVAAAKVDVGFEETKADINTEGRSEESLEATENKVTVDEMVIYEENGVRITVKGLEDSWFGTDLKLLIENDSDKSIVVQARDANVNGYMVPTMMSADVAAGKKINDGLTFETSGLKESGIEEIATMEFKFVIIDGDSWEHIDETDVIKVDTSIAHSYVQKYDDSGNVLVDYNGIRIIEKGLSENGSFWGPGVVLYIENNSEQDITVQVRDVSINGYMVESMISEEVLIGKKSITDLQFLSNDLKENDITKIEDIEFYFHIFNWKDYDSIYDSDIIKLSY